MSPRLRIVPAVLALPLLGGSVCGEILVDIAQRDLILDPVATVDFGVDSGSVEVYAFERNGISLFYYMYGSLDIIGDVGHDLVARDDGDKLDVVSECSGRKGLCNVNWYAEIMLGTMVTARTDNGAVKITGVDAAIEADVGGGDFDGVALASPELDVVVEQGDANVELVLAPTRVAIEVGTGNVSVTVPAGSYACELDTADGDIDTTGIECDDTATSTISITIAEAGDIVVSPGT